MIIIDDKIISDDIYKVYFSCDLQKCKGACCIEGDAGASLEEEEISVLEDDIDYIKPFMTQEGIREVEKHGVFDYDDKGDYVTPLVSNLECAYVNYEGNDIAYCAIEKAWEAQKTGLRKPVSCHLYPLRIYKHRNYYALNYHRWNICKHALFKGRHEKLFLYFFLKDALIRKYGKEWYERLVKAIKNK